MSPAEAWQSPIYKTYLVIVLVLLAVAGGLIVYLKRGGGPRTASLWTTYRGWLVMAPLVLAVAALGRTAVIVAVTALALAALVEFARATGLIADRVLTGFVAVSIVAVGVVIWMPDPRLEKPGWYGLFMALPMWFTAVLLVIPVLRNQPHGQLQKVALSLVAFTYFGWMFGHLAYLANSPHAYGYLLFLLLAVEINDIAAFSFGKLIGQRKLRSQISPNKTVGGSVGALGVSLLMPWLLWFSFPHFDGSALLLTGLVVGVGGQLGDLTISFIKRDLEIKDMGSLIPGHGGVLDRIDSLIYTAPLFFHVTRWFYDI